MSAYTTREPKSRRKQKAHLGGGTSGQRREQATLGALLALPAVAMIVVFVLTPLVSAIYYSFTDYSGFGASPAFVGLDNYVRMFTDRYVGLALRNNFIWIILGTSISLVAAFILAVVIWSTKGAKIYRLMFFLPFVLPAVVVGIVWTWIYDPQDGMLNRALEVVGLGSLARGWLGDPDFALLAVLLTAIWTATGVSMVIFLAALGDVDVELVEAAKLDGAGFMRRLWSIILPQTISVVVMVATLTLLGGFSVFEIVFILTNGGPGRASEVLATYSFRTAFGLNKIGYGTTLALLVTILSVPTALLMNWIQRKTSLEKMGA